MRPLLPGAEPFRFDGSGDAGVLLVHGFTGSPAEMRPLAEHLAARGIASIGVLLRGHGTHPDDLLGCSYHDWLADAQVALEELRGQHRSVFLVGLSMGGAIALRLAARHAGDPRMAGVVPICAPIRLHDWRLGYVGLLQHLVRWHAWGKPDLKDVSAWDRLVGYRRFRTGTVSQVLGLIDETRDILPRVRQPVLVVHARADHVVPARNAELIFDALGSSDKDLLWLDDCYHIATMDHAAPILNAAVSDFIAARAARPSAHLGASVRK